MFLTGSFTGRGGHGEFEMLLDSIDHSNHCILFDMGDSSTQDLYSAKYKTFIQYWSSLTSWIRSKTNRNIKQYKLLNKTHLKIFNFRNLH